MGASKDFRAVVGYELRMCFKKVILQLWKEQICGRLQRGKLFNCDLFISSWVWIRIRVWGLEGPQRSPGANLFLVQAALGLHTLPKHLPWWEGHWDTQWVLRVLVTSSASQEIETCRGKSSGLGSNPPLPKGQATLWVLVTLHGNDNLQRTEMHCYKIIDRPTVAQHGRHILFLLVSPKISLVVSPIHSTWFHPLEAQRPCLLPISQDKY